MTQTEQTMTENTSSLSSPAIAETVSPATDYIVEPWVGLIILGVLLLTGVVAVIREIQVENQDQS